LSNVGTPGEERRQKAQAANHAATLRLRAKYAAEFEALVVEERASRGLAPERTEIQRLRARVAELEAELERRDEQVGR